MAVFPSNIVFKNSPNSYSALTSYWAANPEERPGPGELFISRPRSRPNSVSLLSLAADNESMVSVFGNFTTIATGGRFREAPYGSYLVWDSGSSRWLPRADFPFDLSGELVSDFDDVSYNADCDGSILTWNGSEWVAAPGFFPGGTASLSDFEGVEYYDEPIADKSTLKWDQTLGIWRNVDPVEIGLKDMFEVQMSPPDPVDRDALGYFEETGEWGPKALEERAVVIITDGKNEANPLATSEIVTGEISKIVPFDANTNPIYGLRSYGTPTSLSPYAGVYSFKENLFGSSVEVEEFLPWGVRKVYGGLDITPFGNFGSSKYVFIIDSGCTEQEREAADPDALNLHREWSRDFTSDGDPFFDATGHGSHVAGTVGGKVGGGPIGVAPGAQLIIVKVFGYSGSAPEGRIIAAVEYCRDIIEENAIPYEDCVINMSLGGPTSNTGDDPLSATVRSTAATGIRFAVAAGNATADVDTYSPAQAGDHPNVWSVAACNEYDEIAYFSNYDLTSPIDEQDIQYAAPGVDIVSFSNFPGYFETYDGTSMACPHVAGLLVVGGYNGIKDGPLQLAAFEGLPDYPLSVAVEDPTPDPNAPEVPVYAEVRGEGLTDDYWAKFPDGAFHFRGIYGDSINLQRESMEGFFPPRTAESFSFQFWFRLDADASDFQNRLFYGFGVDVCLGRRVGNLSFEPTPWAYYDSSNPDGITDGRGGLASVLDPDTADIIIRFDPVGAGTYPSQYEYMTYGKVYKERDHHLLVSFDMVTKRIYIFLDGEQTNVGNEDYTSPSDKSMMWRSRFAWIAGGGTDTARGLRNMALRGYIADIVTKAGDGAVQTENFTPPPSYGRKLIDPPKAAVGTLGVSPEGVFAWSAQQSPNVWNIALEKEKYFIRDEDIIGKPADYDAFEVPTLTPEGFAGKPFQVRADAVPFTKPVPERLLESWIPMGPEGWGSQTGYLSTLSLDSHIPGAIRSEENLNPNNVYRENFFGSLYVTYKEKEFPQGAVQMLNSFRGLNIPNSGGIGGSGLNYGDRIGIPSYFGYAWKPQVAEESTGGLPLDSYLAAESPGYVVYISAAEGFPEIYVRIDFSSLDERTDDDDDFNYPEIGAKRSIVINTGIPAVVGERNQVDIVYDNKSGFYIYHNGRRVSIQEYSPDNLAFGTYGNIGLPTYVSAVGRFVAPGGIEEAGSAMTGLIGPGHYGDGVFPPGWAQGSAPNTFDFSEAYYRPGNVGFPAFFAYGGLGVTNSVSGSLTKTGENPVSPDGVAFIGAAKSISGHRAIAFEQIRDFQDTDLNRSQDRTLVLGWENQRSFSQFPIEGYFEGLDIAGYEDYSILQDPTDPTQPTFEDTRGSQAGRVGGELIVWNASNKTFAPVEYDPNAKQSLTEVEAVGVEVEGDYLYWNERFQAWENDQPRTEIEWNLVDLIDVNPVDGGGGQDTDLDEIVPWGTVAVWGGYNIANSGNVGAGKYAFVIDSGCLPLDDFRFIEAWCVDFTAEDNPFKDDNGHGTHVAGTIAASRDGSGIVGVAPGTNIIVVKVFDGSGRADTGTIIAAVNYCKDIIEQNNLSYDDCVVNMSLGGPARSAPGGFTPVEMPLSTAVRNIANTGIKVAVAAGNSGDLTAWYTPAQAGDHPNVWSVAACNEQGQIPVWSNNDNSNATASNRNVQYAAPGVDVVSYYQDGKLAALNGTSMACPHVAALLLVTEIVDGPLQVGPINDDDPSQPLALAAYIPEPGENPGELPAPGFRFVPPAPRKEQPPKNSVLQFDSLANAWFTQNPEEVSSLRGLSDTTFPEAVVLGSLLFYDARSKKWVVREADTRQFLPDLNDVQLEFPMSPYDVDFFLVYRGGRWMEVKRDTERWGSPAGSPNSGGDNWTYGANEIHDFVPSMGDMLSNYGGTLTKTDYYNEWEVEDGYSWTRTLPAKVGHGDGGDFEAGICLFPFVFGIIGGGNFETGLGDTPIELFEGEAVDGGDFDVYFEPVLTTGQVVIDTKGDTGTGNFFFNYVPDDLYVTWTGIESPAFGGFGDKVSRSYNHPLRFTPPGGIGSSAFENWVYAIQWSPQTGNSKTEEWYGLTTTMTEELNLLDKSFTIEAFVQPNTQITPNPPEMVVLAGGSTPDLSNPDVGNAWRLSVRAGRDGGYDPDVSRRSDTFENPCPSSLIWDMWDDNDVRHRFEWELPRNFWAANFRLESNTGTGDAWFRFPGADYTDPNSANATQSSRHVTVQRDVEKGLLVIWLDEMRFEFRNDSVNIPIRNSWQEDGANVSVGTSPVRLGQPKGDTYEGRISYIKVTVDQAVYPLNRHRPRRDPRYQHSAN